MKDKTINEKKILKHIIKCLKQNIKSHKAWSKITGKELNTEETELSAMGIEILKMLLEDKNAKWYFKARGGLGE